MLCEAIRSSCYLYIFCPEALPPNQKRCHRRGARGCQEAGARRLGLPVRHGISVHMHTGILILMHKNMGMDRSSSIADVILQMGTAECVTRGSRPRIVRLSGAYGHISSNLHLGCTRVHGRTGALPAQTLLSSGQCRAMITVLLL